MLLVALVMTAKKWKNLNVHPLMNELKNVVYLYGGILCSHKKK